MFLISWTHCRGSEQLRVVRRLDTMNSVLNLEARVVTRLDSLLNVKARVVTGLDSLFNLRLVSSQDWIAS
jgi:hypothetical protein